MISLESKEAVVDLPLVDKSATNFPRTNIYVLWRARKDFQESFPPEERAFDTINLLL